MTIALRRPRGHRQPWSGDGEDYVRGRSHITRSNDFAATWILTVARWGGSEFVTSHHTLSGAMAWGDHYTLEASRRAQKVRHLLILTVSSIAAVWFIVTAASTGDVAAMARVWGYLLAVGCFFVAIHEIAVLLDLFIPDDNVDVLDAEVAPIDEAIESMLLTVAHSGRPVDVSPDVGSVRILTIEIDDPQG